MASISKHARSSSLPSRLNQISDFSDSKASTSSSSIGLRVNGLRDLYDSVDNLLHLPNTQRSLGQECQKDMVNELLDELIRLLDLCRTAKDVLLATMISARELQSALRRKRGDTTGLKHAVKEYQSQKKTIKKAFLKVLRDLKSTGSIKRNQETPAAVVTLQEKKVDAELAKKSATLQVANVQKELAQLDLSLQDLVEELEGTFRHLIKTRVSLLDILNY